ncbi:hypothetical protein F3Y22_tig00110017pilonHSYRG00183 [Hibiscus syriacus]|uniref:Paired amphipathic helix protein Sin3-like 2 n=1 Tax=Hibiscus syriacus TaxID=106335 RepID=A0A6A3BQ75_HIBSY|nr:hypothetical protein F3Y22_tig00110017pilonHSYRG00183 [Hibiscus syriacus]
MSGGGRGCSAGGAESSTPTQTDCLTYLNEVKAAFQDQDKYDMFVQVLEDFKAQRHTNPTGFISRVKEFFEGHEHLIYGFNTFLPKEYQIPLDELFKDDRGSMRRKPTKDDAEAYLKQVEETFLDEKDKYIMLLQVLNNFMDKRISMVDVIAQVKGLLRGHTNLINGFSTFLPKGYEIIVDEIMDETRATKISRVN